MGYVILETNYWRVELAEKQIYLGRSYVSCKSGRKSLSELTPEEWLDFQEVVKKLEHVFTETFGATMFNWTCLMNDAYKSDPPNPHVHWHFRPRYQKPVEFMGNTFIDPNFAHHYDGSTESGALSASPDLMAAITTKLKARLSD